MRTSNNVLILIGLALCCCVLGLGISCDEFTNTERLLCDILSIIGFILCGYLSYKNNK